MKRMFCLCIALMLLIQNISFANTDGDEYIASIEFGKKCNAVNAEAKVGDRGGIKVFSNDGVDCWKTDINSGAMYVYVNIDDKILYDELTALEVSVEYFDNANAQFALNYEGRDELYKSTDGVFTTGTKEWKTATFYIDDAKPANGEHGNDMRLTPFVDGKGKSSEDLYFRSIRIKKVKFRNPVKLSYSFTEPGGVYHGDLASATLSFCNEASLPFSISGDVTVYCNGEVCTRELIAFDIDKNGTYELKKDFKLDKYGLYTAKIAIKDSGDYFDWVYDVTFSKSVLNKSHNKAYGTNGHYGQGKGSPAINARFMKDAGCGWARDGLGWDSIEKEKGVYNFSKAITDGVNAYVDNGLEVLYMIGYWNPLYDNGKTPASDEAIEAYAKYAAETVKYFKGKINHFEIWNEYNIKGFNPSSEPPETYAKMLKAAYKAIKEVNPQAVVVGCVTSEIDIGWIKRVFEAGGYDYMDAVSVHPYKRQSPDSDDMRADVKTMKELCLQYGEEKPIWFSEDGYAQSKDHMERYGYTSKQIEINQAKQVIANPVYDLCDNIMMYDFQNDGPKENESEHNYGLIRTWSKIDNPYSAKAGYVSVSFANSFVNENTYEKCIADTEDERIFLYKNEKGKAAAMWSAGAEKRITLKLSDEIEVYDLYGNSEKRTSADNLYTFELGEEIIYISGSFDDIEIVNNPYYAKDKHISAAKGESFEIELDRLAADGEKTFKITDENNLTDLEEITFKSGSGKALIPLKIPNETELLNSELVFTDTNGEVTPIKISVNIKEPVSVSDFRTNMKRKWDYWYAEFELTNNCRSTVSGTIGFEDYEYSPRVPIKFYNLQPGETRTVKIPLKPMRIKKVSNENLMITLDNGVVVRFSEILSFLAARKATDKKPVIDGIIDEGEWQTGTALYINDPDMAIQYKDYGGADDLSAKAYLMWDEEYLYASVQVRDNSFFQEESGQYIWRGDMIQAALFDDLLFENYRGQHFEIGMALTKEGTQTYRYYGLGHKSGLCENIESAVKRNGAMTVYETKIPWSEAFGDLVKIEDGKTVKFSMLVNDNDGSGRRGWLEYGSGIGMTKDPSLYLDLHLIGE